VAGNGLLNLPRFSGLLVVLAIDEFRAFSQCGQTLNLPASFSRDFLAGSYDLCASEYGKTAIITSISPD
jgi:hypothetical protein